MKGEQSEPQLPLTRKCELLGVPRSSFYEQRKLTMLPADATLAFEIDRIYTETPLRQQTDHGSAPARSYVVNRKRSAPDAHHGHGHCSGIMTSKPTRNTKLPLPAQKPCRDASEPGLEH